MKIRLEKRMVCIQCQSVGIIYNDCICTYSNDYDTIELEFEVCNCCGHLINDGYSADTEFNRLQLEKIN